MEQENLIKITIIKWWMLSPLILFILDIPWYNMIGSLYLWVYLELKTDSNHEENARQIQTRWWYSVQSWPIFLKFDKETRKDTHRAEVTSEMWQSNAMWYPQLDSDRDHAKEKKKPRWRLKLTSNQQCWCFRFDK